MESPNSAWVVLSGLFVYFIYRIGGQLRDALTFGTDALVDRAVRAIKLPIAGRSTVRRYCRTQLQGSSRYLAAASTVTRLLPTDDVYVPVAARGAEGTNALELTAGHSLPTRLVLVGPPGSGKTTVCKYLFRQACKALIDRVSSSPLPVYLPLDRLGLEEIPAKDPGAWLLTRLASAIEASGLYRAEECFQIYLNKPGVAVFLDGLDELPPAQHRMLVLALVDLDSRLRALSERSRILITLRPSALASLLAVTGQQFEVYRLEPLTSETIFRFLQRWPSADPLFGYALFERLAGTPELLEVCSSPLALAMYAAHAERDAGGTTFRSRTELYRAITDELLVRRAELVELHLPETDTVERRRRFLGRLASVHLADLHAPANSIHAPTLLSAARETLGLDGPEAVAEVAAVARETGLLELLGRHQGARFIHLSFLDFFAADEAARSEDGWVRLLELRSRLVAEHGAEAGARLTEVCVFLAGLSDPAPAGLLAALGQADGSEVALRAFIEAREYRIEAFPRLVQAEMEILFAEPLPLSVDRWSSTALRVHAALEDARWLDPGNVAARRLHAHFAAQVSRLSPVRRRFLLDQLARTDAVSACQFARDLGIDVFTDLPDLVLDNLDQPRFMSWLLARLDRDVNGHEVALLAEGTLRNPFARHQASASLPPPVCQGDPAQYAWAGRIGLPDSTYTRLVSVATSAEGRRFASDDTPAVRLVFSVPAPAWQRLVPNLRTVAMMSAGLVLGLSILVSDERRTVGWLVVQTLLLGLAPLAIVLARGALVRLCYWKVLFSQRDGRYQPAAPDLVRGTRRSPVSRWVASAFGRNLLDLSRAVGNIPRELDAAVASMQELVAATEGFQPPRVRTSPEPVTMPAIPGAHPAATPRPVPRPLSDARPKPPRRVLPIPRLGRVPAGGKSERGGGGLVVSWIGAGPDCPQAAAGGGVFPDGVAGAHPHLPGFGGGARPMDCIEQRAGVHAPHGARRPRSDIGPQWARASAHRSRGGDRGRAQGSA